MDLGVSLKHLVFLIFASMEALRSATYVSSVENLGDTRMGGIKEAMLPEYFCFCPSDEVRVCNLVLRLGGGLGQLESSGLRFIIGKSLLELA